MTTQTTTAHEALRLTTLGRATIDRIAYVAYSDDAYTHVVAAEDYDADHEAIEGGDLAEAYDAWCSASVFPADAIAVRVARAIGLDTIHSATDGVCSRLDVDAACLARAAAHVSAVELPDGDYAYYADETSTYWVVDADDLADLCDYLDDTDDRIASDAYSHWCAGSSAREQPSGWTPDEAWPITLTYQIHDGDPAASSGTELTAADVTEDTLEECITAVREAVEVYAAGLSADDGYAVGDRLWTVIDMPDGTIVITHTLTADDLGTE